jgi:hypothetical protein
VGGVCLLLALGAFASSGDAVSAEAPAAPLERSLAGPPAPPTETEAPPSRSPGITAKDNWLGQ